MTPSLIRAETLSPSLTGPSDLSSFLFKLFHGLLPTQDTVTRLGLTDNDTPGNCLIFRTEPEDLLHSFFGCIKSLKTGLTTLGYVHHVVPYLTPESALLLHF